MNLRDNPIATFYRKYMAEPFNTADCWVAERLFKAPKGFSVSGNTYRWVVELDFVRARLAAVMMVVIDLIIFPFYLLGLGRVPHCRFVYEKEVQDRAKNL